MSHVHVKINFSKGIDSWNRCLSVHKRLQIRAQATQAGGPVRQPYAYLVPIAPIAGLKLPTLLSHCEERTDYRL
jgi:hypothetical protein